MADRVVVLVQARMGSSRFPGKSLRPLMGRPMIAHVLERAALVRASRVVLVTSTSERDDALADAGAELGVPVHRGPELDVLTRMHDAAREHAATTVVRVTGDCPLLAPDVCRRVVNLYARSPIKVHYASNDTTASGFPDGTDVEVFGFDALLDAATHARRGPDREHVTPWIRRELITVTLQSDRDASRAKLSVDTPEDLERVSRVMQRAQGPDLSDTIAAAEACGLL